MAGTGEEFGPCPFCGKLHTEDVLLCPDSEKLLPLEGRMLDGKFRFTRMLGEGGMGAVWKAENILVKKDVAIKLMHVQFSRDEGVLARFRNEATAAGRIGSDHICDILDLGKSTLGPYIVMEMLVGKDFATFLQDMHGRVDPGLSVLIIREALVGLQAAHDAGIIHRDLKPENIFLHEPKPGKLLTKLMDFGISKFTEGSEAGKTGMGVLMGTPEYMSPEQTEGAAQVDHRTDIWAMGVIMYWALTGRNPFVGPTMAATLVNVSTKPPPPLASVAPHVDPGLIAIIDRCIAKSPADRWNSCTELSAALAPYENPDNGIYTVDGHGPATTSKPGATVASSGPPPGATVASGFTPMPSPGTPPPGSPTFGNRASGPGAAPTWTGEVSNRSAQSAPTIGTGSAFLSDHELDARPDTNIGGGKGLMIGVIVLLLGGLGVGGFLMRDKLTGSSDSSDDGGGEVVAVADDGAAADEGGKAEGDGAAADDKADAGADAGAEAGAAEAGAAADAGAEGGAAEAGADGGAAEAGADGGAADGGAADGGAADGGAADGGAADGGAADGGAADGGAADGGAAADGGDAGADAGADGGAADDGKADDGGGDDGAADGGGDDGGKSNGGTKTHHKSEPKFDKKLVRKVSSNLYVAKRLQPPAPQPGARSQCTGASNKKFGGLKGWTLPTAAQAKRSGASGTFWTNERGIAFDSKTKKTTRAHTANVVCVTKGK